MIINARPSPRFLRSFSSTPWAILPEKLAEILGAIEALRCGTISAADLRAATRVSAGPETRTGVAVVPVFGTLFPRGGMLVESSGGTSAEAIGRSIDAAVADPQVSSIVLDVDSPGGQVGGVPELAAKIRAAREVKPITAVANHLMASAAYWIASAATRVVASPSATVGSIGVLLVHFEEVEAYARAGIKPTVFSAGRLKAAGHELLPLSEEAAGLMQTLVDQTFEKFVDSVSKNRGVSTRQVVEGFGEGFVKHADDALAAGMVDAIGTLDQVVAGELKRNGGSRRASRSAAATMIRIRSACADILKGETR